VSSNSDQYMAVGFGLFVALGLACVLYRPRIQQPERRVFGLPL